MVAWCAGVIVGESVGYYSVGMLRVNPTERPVLQISNE